jgi:hypothetical protein
MRMCGLKAQVVRTAFLAALVAAAFAPFFLRTHESAVTADDAFPGWPASYEDFPLTELLLTQRELAFVRDFPGRVGRFTDGRREIIIRWIGAPTRRLHSAADCLRGTGYGIAPIPARKDATGAAMGCFRATHGNDELMICEIIRDSAGNSWPDVSAWYWNAMFGTSRTTWWSFVVAEKVPQQQERSINGSN